jgi:hypothetical protein
LSAADFNSVNRTLLSLTWIVVVVVVAFALGGCMSASNNPVSNGNRLSAEATLTVINANMTTALTSDPGSLPQLTQQYITAVQGSQALLGAAEAKQKLTDTAAQLAPYCSACVQSLDAAAAQISP